MLKPGVTLYFIRHGETDWNRDRRYQGQMDIPLNATGREQAARNGRVLAATLGARAAGLDYVASPLERARETMQIVRGELGLAPDAYRTDDRLKEVHYGHWEGQLQDELRTSDPEGFAARDLDAWGWQPRGGDRQLNRALYLVAVTKRRRDPPTKAYIARRVADGKTEREAIRCIKRYLARRVWRLLEHPPIGA